MDLLHQVDVTAVVDVRSRPYSGRQPQFNRPELQLALQNICIQYAFFGATLGGRPEQRSVYDEDGRVNYERVRQTRLFQRGLEELMAAGKDYRIAMLCAEEDPLDCHRGLMIAPALAEHGLKTFHIRGDGSIETTEELELRLLEGTGVGSGLLDGLFAAVVSPEERAQTLAEAYRVMGRRKAFRLRPEEMDSLQE